MFAAHYSALMQNATLKSVFHVSIAKGIQEGFSKLNPFSQLNPL